jgi:hypothetical protein
MMKERRESAAAGERVYPCESLQTMRCAPSFEAELEAAPLEHEKHEESQDRMRTAKKWILSPPTMAKWRGAWCQQAT